MSMRFEIRQAAPFDASAACALLRRSIEIGCRADHEGKPAVLEAWLGNKTSANVATWFASPSNFAVVAEGEEGKLLGLCLLTQAGKVALCYVLPDALRVGVGRALLDAVEQQARTWNIKKLHLYSPPSASAFFERQGYLNAGKDTSCFGMESDLLWKSLEANCELAPGAARKRFCNCNG